MLCKFFRAGPLHLRVWRHGAFAGVWHDPSVFIGGGNLNRLAVLLLLRLIPAASAGLVQGVFRGDVLVDRRR